MDDQEQVALRGTLRRAERDMAYGSHAIDNYGELHALTSEEVDLDEYVGREIGVMGFLIEGYAQPRYVNVTAVDTGD